jgi:hypothetical protein
MNIRCFIPALLYLATHISFLLYVKKESPNEPMNFWVVNTLIMFTLLTLSFYLCKTGKNRSAFWVIVFFFSLFAIYPMMAGIQYVQYLIRAKLQH